MKPMLKTKTEEVPTVKVEQAKEEETWNDQLEAIKYTTQVFADIDKQLGTDLVLARLEPRQREFIIEQVKLAIALKKQIPWKPIGHRVFLTIITEVLMTAILHRNVTKNTLLEIIGGVHTGPREEEGNEITTLAQKTTGGLKQMLPNKKEKMERIEEG